MGIEHYKGVNNDGEDVCILVKTQEQKTIDYCEFLEIARLMNWTISKEDLDIGTPLQEIDWP